MKSNLIILCIVAFVFLVAAFEINSNFNIFSDRDMISGNAILIDGDDYPVRTTTYRAATLTTTWRDRLSTTFRPISTDECTTNRDCLASNCEICSYGRCIKNCPAGSACRSGTCQKTCTPNCLGKTCGTDGCGGACGTCTYGKECSGSKCLISDGHRCSLGSDCASGNCVKVVGGSEKVCRPAGYAYTPCGGPCPAGKTCVNDACVIAGCTTDNDCSYYDCKICRNGQCVSKCTAGFICNDGNCEKKCTPDCTGKVCGPDGCGGNCGSCASGKECSNEGKCQTSVGHRCSLDSDCASGNCIQVQDGPEKVCTIIATVTGSGGGGQGVFSSCFSSCGTRSCGYDCNHNKCGIGDCAAGYLCTVDGKCLKEEGRRCTADADCASGRCIPAPDGGPEKTCGPYLITSSSTKKSKIGEACNIPSDCETGTCNDFYHICANVYCVMLETEQKQAIYYLTSTSTELQVKTCSGSDVCINGLGCRPTELSNAQTSYASNKKDTRIFTVNYGAKISVPVCTRQMSYSVLDQSGHNVVDPTFFDSGSCTFSLPMNMAGGVYFVVVPGYGNFMIGVTDGKGSDHTTLYPLSSLTEEEWQQMEEDQERVQPKSATPYNPEDPAYGVTYPKMKECEDSGGTLEYKCLGNTLVARCKISCSFLFIPYYCGYRIIKDPYQCTNACHQNGESDYCDDLQVVRPEPRKECDDVIWLEEYQCSNTNVPQQKFRQAGANGCEDVWKTMPGQSDQPCPNGCAMIGGFPKCLGTCRRGGEGITNAAAYCVVTGSEPVDDKCDEASSILTRTICNEDRTSCSLTETVNCVCDNDNRGNGYCVHNRYLPCQSDCSIDSNGNCVVKSGSPLSAQSRGGGAICVATQESTSTCRYVQKCTFGSTYVCDALGHSCISNPCNTKHCDNFRCDGVIAIPITKQLQGNECICVDSSPQEDCSKNKCLTKDGNLYFAYGSSGSCDTNLGCKYENMKLCGNGLCDENDPDRCDIATPLGSVSRSATAPVDPCANVVCPKYECDAFTNGYYLVTKTQSGAGCCVTDYSRKFACGTGQRCNENQGCVSVFATTTTRSKARTSMFAKFTEYLRDTMLS